MTDVPGSIAFGALTLQAQPAAAPSYLIQPGTGLAGMTRRRDVVTSPWVDGETEVASVRGALSYVVVVLCRGTSWANATALAQALVDEAEQLTWTLAVTLDGHTDTYDASAAAQIEMPLERDYLINAARTVTLTIPVRKA